MMIFIDCWLRYDIDESWELPGNEFIRMVRILVKQLHFFGNVAEQDLSSLSILRQQAQSLLNLRIYPFLKTIISRWPLDTSFLNVLELWLSFIQPWRYLYDRNIQNLNNEIVDIPERFRNFISENIICYTQIFIRLIPRFQKMDLSLSKNAFMLFRMLKVFRQLSEVLREIERLMMNNNSTIRAHSSFNEIAVNMSPTRISNSFNRSGERSPHHRSYNQSVIEDSNYVSMFSDEITMATYELMQKLFVAKTKTCYDVNKMEKELHKHTSLWEKFLQFIGWLSSLSLSFTVALEEKKKTPIYLEFCLNVFSQVFNIPIEDATKEFELEQNNIMEDSDDDRMTNIGSDFLSVTPSFMKQRLLNISYTGDPFLLPIMNHEVKFLVRFLHQISSKINEMVRLIFQNFVKLH
jgi:sphingomyelin phosphodiesterase 4